MISRHLGKPCHDGVFNAVVRLSHHMVKVSKFARSNMTHQYLSVFASMYTCSVVTSFVHEIRNSFLMHLFSKAWIYCSIFFSSVHASHPCVSTGQTNAFIGRNLVAVLTDFFRHIFVNLFITTISSTQPFTLRGTVK